MSPLTKEELEDPDVTVPPVSMVEPSPLTPTGSPPAPAPPLPSAQPTSALNKNTRVFRPYQTISPTASVLNALTVTDTTGGTGTPTGSGAPAVGATVSRAGALKSAIAKNGAIAAAVGMGSGSGSIEEDAPSYNPTYPYNTVLVESEAGHLIEVDDSPGAERIHIYHRSGSHIEMRPDGGVKYKSVKKRQDVTIGDNEVLISGDYNIVVEGGYTLHVRKGELIIDAKDDAAINVKGKLKIQADNIEMKAINKIFLNAPKVDIGGISPGGTPMMSLPGGVVINDKYPLDPTFVPKVNLPINAKGLAAIKQASGAPDIRFNGVSTTLTAANNTANTVEKLALTTKAATLLYNGLQTPATTATLSVLDAAIAKALKENSMDASGEPAISLLTEQPGELPLSNPTLYRSAQVLGAGQQTGSASTPTVYQKLRGRAFDTPEDVGNIESYNTHINLSVELGDFQQKDKAEAGQILQSDTTPPAAEPKPAHAFPLPSGGTVRVTEGSRELRGTNTIFDEDLEVGDTVELNGTNAIIESVASNTVAILTAPWGQTSQTGTLRVYRLRPPQHYFGKFMYSDTDPLGHSGLHLRDMMVNFTSPVIEVPQINAAMLTVSSRAGVSSGEGVCGTPANIPALDIVKLYNDASGLDPDKYDIRTHAGAGRFTEYVIEHSGSEWGHINKTSGQNQYNGHAVDAIMYRSPVPLYNGLQYQPVDIIFSVDSPEARPQFVPVCAPDNGSRWGGKG